MCGNVKLCRKTMDLNGLKITLIIREIKYIDTSSVEYSQNYCSKRVLPG